MPFATIAGTTARMVDFERLPDERGGRMQRTLSGQRRGSALWVARAWQGVALCTSDAEANTLRALANDTTPRVCAGDGFPAGGVTCHVECTGDAYEHLRGGTWRRRLSLSFREVL